jgi:hypothetical protein
MNGLFFLLFNIGVVVVARWCLQNDSTSLDGVTKGLFAMAKSAQRPATGSASAPAARKVASPKLRLPRLVRR